MVDVVEKLCLSNKEKKSVAEMSLFAYQPICVCGPQPELEKLCGSTSANGGCSFILSVRV